MCVHWSFLFFKTHYLSAVLLIPEETQVTHTPQWITKILFFCKIYALPDFSEVGKKLSKRTEQYLFSICEGENEKYLKWKKRLRLLSLKCYFFFPHGCFCFVLRELEIAYFSPPSIRRNVRKRSLFSFENSSNMV